MTSPRFAASTATPHEPRAIAAAALSVLLSLIAPVATASTFIKLEIADLVREAERGVFAGQVLSMKSSWNTEKSMIWTEVSVLVREDLTGPAKDVGRTLVFRVPGGRVADREVTMAGAPRFEVGEPVVVFATTWPDGSLMVAGYFQGLSFVRPGPRGQPVLVEGRADGMTVDSLREAVRAERARLLSEGGSR